MAANPHELARWSLQKRRNPHAGQTTCSLKSRSHRLLLGARTYVRQNTAVLMRGDLHRVLPHVAAPTAVIVGAEDIMTPVAQSQAIHELVPGSTLHVIPGCGHLPPIERPDETAVLLRALLNR